MTISLLWMLYAHAEDLATGLLKIKSATSGAEVYLDGTLIGTVPLTQLVPVGQHQVRVVADNFDPFVRKVEVVEGQTTEVNATLSAGGGTVEFTGPANARVWIDGQDRGALPIRIRDLAPGDHQWRVEAPYFENAEGVLTLAKGKNYLLNVELQSSRGIFVIESTPPGATVILDGKNVGVTPLRLTDIPSGPHNVRLDLDGHASVYRSLDTTDGRRGEVKASLPEEGSSLVIVTGSNSARVLVNDIEVGTGDRVEVGPYEKGRYKVTVQDGSTTITQSVSFPANGSLSLKRQNDELIEQKPLVQRWGFWAIVGGVAAAGGAAAVTTAVVTAPEPLPTGDVTVELP